MALLAPSGIINRRGFRSSSVVPTPPPSGIAYADAPAVAISVINFTLFKENTFGDGNILYNFDQSYDTPPNPANYYAFSDYNFETGNGNRAILAFNTSATTYYSNQSSFAPDVSLSQNAWILIVFSAGSYDDGTTPPVPTSIYVNNSSGQSANYIPTTGWSPTLTIKNGAYAADANLFFNFSFAGLSDQLQKFSNTNWSNNFEEGGFSLTWNNVVANQWALDCDGSGTLPAARATSTNGSNSSIIPLDGWSYTIGSGQSITLLPFLP